MLTKSQKAASKPTCKNTSKKKSKSNTKGIVVTGNVIETRKEKQVKAIAFAIIFVLMLIIAFVGMYIHLFYYHNTFFSKLKTITKLFNGSEIRSIWDDEKEDYYFSVVDIVSILTESNDPSHYWRTLKSRMIKEGNETVTKCDTFKFKAKDGKMRKTDVLDTEGIFRLIESIPSPNAEPFKLWLAKLGKERVDEVFDPEIAINRSITYYKNRGYSDEWIKKRLIGILNRNKLTDVWKRGGIKEGWEFGALTNEIYKEWSDMTAKEYKNFKGLRKENLRDNMTDLEIALTDLGEIATRVVAEEKKPQGFKENKKVAKIGGHAAKVAREDIEKNLQKPVITSTNALNYKYDNNSKIEIKEESR